MYVVLCCIAWRRIFVVYVYIDAMKVLCDEVNGMWCEVVCDPFS